MFGPWELLLLGIIIGIFVFPYVRKKLNQISPPTPQRPPRPKEPRTIDLDDDNYEVVDGE